MIGQAVPNARFHGFDGTFTGIIVDLDDNGTVQLLYDDGESETVPGRIVKSRLAGNEVEYTPVS